MRVIRGFYEGYMWAVWELYQGFMRALVLWQHLTTCGSTEVIAQGSINATKIRCFPMFQFQLNFDKCPTEMIEIN